MAERNDGQAEEKPGQPAPKRFQPPPEVSRQSDDPAEPDEIDVMVHNKPQADGAASEPKPSYKEMRAFARDDEEDLQGEEDLAKQLRQADEADSDRG